MIKDQILQTLAEKDVVLSTQLEDDLKISAEDLYSELVSLNSANYILLQAKKNTELVLTKQGLTYSNQGCPEYYLYSLATLDGVKKNIIEPHFSSSQAFQLALNNALKNKFVIINKELISRIKDDLNDRIRQELLSIKLNKENNLNPETIKELKRRKLVEDKHSNIYLIKKGTNYKEKRVNLRTDLTSGMLTDCSWKNQQFKEFNPNARGLPVQNGNLHPLMKTKQQFTEILTQMGFQEMNTNRYVESSFWNFDSLFQPQAHPARDAHDTFFLSKPSISTVEDAKYFEETKNIHEKGGFGSLGLDYTWNPDEAFKNILRTHTTAISSRYLKMLADELAQGKQFRPRKFFSIDRVFRNQTLDNTHLAEFHQVQGFIIDYDLGLADLIGVLTAFYNHIGIKDIKVKPTFNPYTQPSMEVFGYHPILGRKVEIGNSGIFRPQMLRPMGFPQNISVIAWGLSLERPTMIQFGLSNIKELFGPGISVKKVKESSIYCL